MVMDKTSIFAFPTPAYQYGAADGSAAAAEFTSSMTAAEGTIVAALNTISNNVSVVSAALAAKGNANTVSAQLVSVSAIIANTISVVSNAVSIVSQAVSVVSAAGAMRAVNTADQATISVSTLVAVSGVNLTLASGSNYFFKFIVPFTLDVTTGVTIGVSGPTVNNFIAKTELPLTGSAQATTYSFGTLGTIGGKVSTASVPLSGVTLLALVEGYINPSNTTPLAVSIGPTVTGGNLVVRKGALAVAWKIS